MPSPFFIMLLLQTASPLSALIHQSHEHIRFICILRFRNRRKIFFKPPFLWEIHFSLSLPLRFLSISIHYWEKNADIMYLLYHIYSKLSTPEVIFFIFSNIFLILADFLWLYRWCMCNKFFSFINFLFPAQRTNGQFGARSIELILFIPMKNVSFWQYSVFTDRKYLHL